MFDQVLRNIRVNVAQHFTRIDDARIVYTNNATKKQHKLI